MNAVPRITSRAEFGAALRWGLGTACTRGARRLWCVDRSFADWPLDDAALLEQLSAWLRRPQRRLVLLAGSYDEMVRWQPRFVAWRRDWAHAVEAWQTPANADDLPTVLVDDAAVCVQLADRVHWRGRAGLDARAAQGWREEIDVVLQRSEASFPVKLLGL